MKSPFVYFVAALLSGQSLLATSLYVDANNGDDANNGFAWNTAFATIGKAASVSLPGDVISVNNGSYPELIEDPPSGSDGSPIVYQAIGQVTIGTNGDYGFRLINSGDYLVIRGFRFIDTDGRAINVDGRTFVTIEDNEFISCGRPFDTQAVSFKDCTDSAFRKNRVSNGDHGFQLYNGFRNILDQNTFNNFSGGNGNSTYYAIRYYNYPQNTNRFNTISHNILSNCSWGFYERSYTGNSDQFVSNAFFGVGSERVKQHDNGSLTGYQTFGTDTLYVDPLYVAGTLFLQPSSPMLAAGELDPSTGKFKDIGALSTATVSTASDASSWDAWMDGNGDAVSSSSLVEVDSAGKVVLKDGVTAAVLLSPVIDSGEATKLKRVHLNALQAPFLPSGSRQLIDYDNSTAVPEFRYRYADDVFTQNAAEPAWAVAVVNNALNVTGRYFQAELVLRKDGN